MPARKDAIILAEAARIRDDDGRRKAVRELSKSKRASEIESGTVALSMPKLRKQWRDERIDGKTDLQWDEWLAKRKND